MKLASHPSVQSISSIYDFCAPLRDRFDLTAFSYDMSFPGAELSMLVDGVEIFEPYYSQDLTPVCSNASGRTIENGVYTAKMLYKKHENPAQITNFKSMFKSDFGIHLVNRIPSINGLKGYDELVSFAFSMYEDQFEHFILNNVEGLKNFVRCFRQTMRPKIINLQQKENRLFFPDLLEINDLNALDISANKPKKIEASTIIITREDGAQVSLTPQQSYCLKLLIEGKSIKAVAAELMLSPRTVENYFFVVREKLNCSSLIGLLGRYGDQLR